MNPLIDVDQFVQDHKSQFRARAQQWRHARLGDALFLLLVFLFADFILVNSAVIQDIFHPTINCHC